MDFIGIVGARNFKDKKSVQNLVNSLSDNSAIVTGACKGVCAWTIEEAKKIGIDVLVYKPDLENIRSNFEVAKRYYQRNRELIEKCNFVHAFISKENGLKGGTKFEIEYAVKLGKPFKLHTENIASEIVYQFNLSSFDNPFLNPVWIDFFVETFCR